MRVAWRNATSWSVVGSLPVLRAAIAADTFDRFTLMAWYAGEEWEGGRGERQEGPTSVGNIRFRFLLATHCHPT